MALGVGMNSGPVRYGVYSQMHLTNVVVFSLFFERVNWRITYLKSSDEAAIHRLIEM